MAIPAGHTDGWLDSSGGVQLYWQGWLPAADPRAVAVLVHGGLEHGGRYGHVAERLCASGIAAYVVDFRGHGRSGGRPAQIGTMGLLVGDLRLMVALATQRHSDIPVFVVAHSLGSMVALEYVLDGPVELRGVVLSGTGIDVSALPALQVRLARMLSAVAPNLPLVKFRGDGVSRDPEVLSAYKSDPLNFHGRVPARTPAELFASADRLIPQLGRIEVPVLVVHGGADPIAAPSGARMVHDRVRSADKTLIVYNGLQHEIFNEPERDAVLTDVVEWISERV